MLQHAITIFDASLQMMNSTRLAKSDVNVSILKNMLHARSELHLADQSKYRNMIKRHPQAHCNHQEQLHDL